MARPAHWALGLGLAVCPWVVALQGCEALLGVGSLKERIEDGGAEDRTSESASDETSSPREAGSSGTGADGSAGAPDSRTDSASSGGAIDSGFAAEDAPLSASEGGGDGAADAASEAAVDAATSCPVPSGVTLQQSGATEIVNQTRASMGSPCATMVPALNTAATQHCAYYAANTGNPSCVSNPHVEVSGCTSYVAASFGTRDVMAGYSGMPSAEVMAFDDDPMVAIGQWMGSVYHRTPVLDPWTLDLGYGTGAACDTLDFGVGAGSSTPDNVIVSYPYDGQTGVGSSFNGQMESPTPPAPPGGWPSGYPIHVYMHATTVTVTTDEFGVDGGMQLAHQIISPQSSNGYLTNVVVLYGNSPLASHTTYRVHLAGTRQYGASSVPFDVSFTFTTN